MSDKLKHFLAYAHSAQTTNQEALREERIDWSFHVVALDYEDAWHVASTHVAWSDGYQTRTIPNAVLLGVVEHPNPHGGLSDA